MKDLRSIGLVLTSLILMMLFTNISPVFFEMDKDQIKRLIKEEAKKYGIDEDFAVKIVCAESSLRPNETGIDGEIGLFQLHPKYLQWFSEITFGPEREITLKEAYDIRKNIKMGCRYLSFLKKRLGKHYTPALLAASYNAGFERVKKAGFKVPSFLKNHPNKIYRKILFG